MTSTFPDPRIFLRASDLVQSGLEEYACLAIAEALKVSPYEMRLYSPEYALFKSLYCRWIIWSDERAPWFFWFAKTRRVRALRRCAEIAQETRDRLALP